MHNTTIFRGLDCRERCPDGAFEDMTNGSTVDYPYLSTRPLRSTLVGAGINNACGLIRKTMYISAYGDTVDCLCIPVNGLMKYYYFDGAYLRLVTSTTGSLNTLTKQMASMGSKLIIWPDKKYIDMYAPEEIKSLGDSSTNPIPDLDFICECGNRLWGCRYCYDATSGTVINELYASALGDPTKWNQLDGLSTDSWTASCGSDGRWTGAICYNGYPTFFKEHSITRIYPSATGAHKVVEYPVPGVGDMSGGSLVNLGGVLYYMGVDGVYAWDGGQPVKISAALGTQRYGGGVAGTEGSRYHLNAVELPGGAGYVNLVYDPATGLWAKEDTLRIRFFAEMGGHLYFINTANWYLMCKDTGSYSVGAERFYGWTMVSGKQFYGSEASVSTAYKYAPLHVLPGKFVLRMDAPSGTEFRLDVRFDDEVAWTTLLNFNANSDGIYIIPMTPHRCGYFQWRLNGSGTAVIQEVSYEVKVGTDAL